MKRPNLRQLLARSSGLMGARLAGGAIALFVNLLIARNFGADTLGLFALAMATASVAAVVLPIGFHSVGTMFVSQYLEQGRHDLVAGFTCQGYRNIAGLTGLAVVVAAALLAAPPVWVHEYALSAVFIVTTAPALALINLNGSVVNAHRRQFAALLPDLVVKPVLMALMIGGVVVLFASPTDFALFGAISAALWASALIQILFMGRIRIAAKPVGKADRRRWRKAALPWMLIAILSDYFIELHLLLAGALSAPAEVAVLHICFRLRVLAAYGMRALYALILPDLYASHERGDDTEFRNNLMRANGLALIYSLAVCAAIIPFGGWVLSLFGDAFVGGRTILMMVCAAMIARAVFGPGPAIMAMKGHHAAAVWILSAGTALSLGAGLALYPTLGIEGIAAAYTLSYSLIAATQWWWVKRNTGIDCSIFACLAGWLGQARLASANR